MSEKSGGPAFPITPYNAAGQTADTFIGISKLDYFAAAALTGLLSDPDNWSEKATYVPDAFDIATAMLAESERRAK